MSANGFRRRLEALEEHTFGADPLRDFSDWDLVDQLEQVAFVLNWYRRFHADGRVRYPATDREIHLLGLLCALWELGGPPPEPGEHRFEGTDLAVVWCDNGDGSFNASTSRPVRLEDLPEDVRVHFERMDPARQPERERFLYGDRYHAKSDRERFHHQERYGREEERRRKEESRRRDRALLECNRAACGLPPLSPEQIEAWGLAPAEPDRGRAGVNAPMSGHQAGWWPVYGGRSGGRSVVFQPRSRPLRGAQRFEGWQELRRARGPGPQTAHLGGGR
jgi:hypothetical protein